MEIPPLATFVALAAFIVNILVIVWSASRSAAKTESSIERAMGAEREKRAEQFYEAREFARHQVADAIGKADAAHSKIADVELRLIQMFAHYPTKTDMRDMFVEKFEPVTDRLDAVYGELMRRGVHSSSNLIGPGDRL